MASFASEVSVTQSDSFFSRFGRFGGDMKLLKQLLADDDWMKTWVESLLVTAPVEHLVAFVSYQLPPYGELKDMVFNWASDLFNGSHVWEEHESVRGQIDRIPGKKSFLVKHFDRKMKSEQVIEWAEANGYRVATHEEAVDFAKAHPDLQRQFWIVALGSFTHGYDDRDVAVLYGDGARRDLDGGWFGREWDASDRFLIVHK
jgi:hypothetical protein